MKYITLNHAIDILEQSSAVIINDQNQAVVFANPNDEDDDFLIVEYQDGDGLEYRFTFEKHTNDEIRVEKFSMYLFDDTGEEVELTILEPKNLEY